MVRQVRQILFILVVVCLPQLAPAGCPLMGAMDATCASDSSSIEGCTNSIWEDYQGIKYGTEDLQRDPKNPSERFENLRATISALKSKIGLLGSASAYKRNFLLSDCNTTSEPTWWAIERCKTQLRSARDGIELLSKQEIVGALSPGSRERLRNAYTNHATQYKGQLDIFATSWTGDPSVLCSETYASVSACRRAVAMDNDAVRRQVFPVYQCSRIVPGRVVTATSDAEEQARHANDTSSETMIWRMSRFRFAAAVRYYQDRLETERSLLAQAQQTH